jgi:hypothetical protein
MPDAALVIDAVGDVYLSALQSLQAHDVPTALWPTVMDAATKRVSDYALAALSSQVIAGQEKEEEDDGEHPAGD